MLHCSIESYESFNFGAPNVSADAAPGTKNPVPLWLNFIRTENLQPTSKREIDKGTNKLLVVGVRSTNEIDHSEDS